MDRLSIPIYPQDPGVLPIVDVEVSAAGILPGPIGQRVAVYEYNRDTDMVYPAARPNGDGTFPSYDADDHRFHQLNAYAITSRAIELVEAELGRDLSWGFEASRLIVLPHAGAMGNAFYEEDTHSLQFYSYQPMGRRGLYHTCLSHDIVAHETGHAILDSIRDRFTEPTHPQTSALHEGVGDLASLFAALSHASVRRRVLKQGLNRANLVSKIAEDFDPEGPIRELFGGPSAEVRRSLEPHTLSLWLTRALYDSLVSFYRLCRAKGQSSDEALGRARRSLQRMVVRGLDYLPVADATFAEVARAVVAADEFAKPGDGLGFRKALVAQLKRHKIITAAGLDEAGRGTGVLWKHLPRSWPRITKQEAYEFLDRHRTWLALSTYAPYRDFVVRDLYPTTGPPEHRDIQQVVITYEYPVDIQFDFDGEKYWHPVWGGGTLVFDWRGRCVHHAEKPVTRDRVERFRGFFDEAYAAIGVVHPGHDDRMKQETGGRSWSLRVGDGDAVLRGNPAARCHVGPTPRSKRR